MTENLRTLLKGAKTIDEAGSILDSHMNELSMDDQMKIFQMAANNDELTEDELDMISGGNWLTDGWNSFTGWCSEHKFAAIVGACVIAGACLFAAGTGALILAGVATYSGTLGAALGGAAIWGGITGTFAGAFVAGMTGNGGTESQDSNDGPGI